jgi:hypothetical protein
VFKHLASRRVATVVISGVDEGRLMRRGEEGVLRRLARGNDFQMEIIPGLDHGVVTRFARQHLAARLTEYVARRYGHPVAPPSPSSMRLP